MPFSFRDMLDPWKQFLFSPWWLLLGIILKQQRTKVTAIITQRVPHVKNKYLASLAQHEPELHTSFGKCWFKKIRIIAQSGLERTSGCHVVQPTDQKKINRKVVLGCPEPYPVKSVRMQIHRLSGHIVPLSLWKSHFALFCFATTWRKVANSSVEWEQNYKM